MDKVVIDLFDRVNKKYEEETMSDEMKRIQWDTMECLQEVHQRYHYGWYGFVPMIWWIQSMLNQEEFEQIKTLVIQNGYNGGSGILISMVKMVKILELFLNQVEENV